MGEDEDARAYRKEDGLYCYLEGGLQITQYARIPGQEQNHSLLDCKERYVVPTMNISVKNTVVDVVLCM